MPRIYIIALILTGFLNLFNKLDAQNLPFIEYGVADGLPHSTDNTIIQDRRGYFWVRSNNRIARFDGIDFINFGRKDTLSGFEIQDHYCPIKI